MASIDWNDGRLITLNGGDTATCNGGLNQGQLYSLIFYNSAGNDASVNITVVAGNSNPPVTVTVPGTTANEGLAAVVFVNGTDANTVSASIINGQPGVEVQAYMASVKMPLNTNGIQNISMPEDGQFHPFNRFTRYYDVPATHWYQATIQSNINQFISIQLMEQSAIVNIVNAVTDPSPNIKAIGSAQNQYKIVPSNYQTASWSLQGNGSQVVWVNADSVQDSQNAGIALQSLSALYS